jgi:hypothetical protein
MANISSSIHILESGVLTHANGLLIYMCLFYDFEVSLVIGICAFDEVAFSSTTRPNICGPLGF